MIRRIHSMDRTTATDISQARELPADMRRDLLQSSDGGYPAGYEELLKSYTLADGEPACTISHLGRWQSATSM